MKYKVKNLKNGKEWFPNPDSIYSLAERGVFGKPERWIEQGRTELREGKEINILPVEDYELDDVLEERNKVRIVNSISGTGISEEKEIPLTYTGIDGNQYPIVEVRLKAEFEIIDITTEITRKEKEEKISKVYNTKTKEHKTFNNYLISVDDKAKVNATSAAVQFILFQSFPSFWVSEYRLDSDPLNPGQMVKAEKDAKITLSTEEDFRSVLSEIAVGWKDSFDRKQALRDKLKSLTTLEELQNFDPVVDWPICLEPGYI